VLLVAEVLDNQLLDSTGRDAGKVDGVIIELRADRPPKLTYYRSGSNHPSRPLQPAAGTMVRAHRCPLRRGTRPAHPHTVDAGEAGGSDPRARLQGESTPIFAVENWLSKHIVARIPGGRRS
jgi:hypothetical protein